MTVLLMSMQEQMSSTSDSLCFTSPQDKGLLIHWQSLVYGRSME